jgi:CubicO group peptidase (beta-lactamase class C family)
MKGYELKKISVFLMVITLSLNVFAQILDLSAIDSVLASSASRLGGSALILVKDGKIIYKKNFGKISLKQKLYIASATKWLSAATILSLVDKGLISLDDPVSKYLKNFMGKKSGITIRQLISHTSGLSTSLLNEDVISPTLKKEVNEIADHLRLNSDPGTEFDYGGVSFQIAGRIAEIVTGKSWETVFRENIADLCNMKNTDYGNTLNPGIAAGALSTGEDYAKFLSMILNNGKFKHFNVLKEGLIEEMKRNQTGSLPIMFSIYNIVDKTRMNTRYGLGVWLEELDTLSQKGKVISSQGAFGFSPWIDFQRNLIGVFVTLDQLQNVQPYYNAIQKIIKKVIP